MSTLKFKSNIKCSGCANTVKPFLDKIDGVTDWSVDFASTEKFLTVKTTGATEEEIASAVKSAGYLLTKI
ncbi:heavy-metal-associated domain-containing protein [Flagellimonas beolgyonensis]|uniref:heavy-metal-associated domain-containing protein n=1 Tax=Flagellimonas beolgyonensis TaxID=864064 RepID=UPI000F8F27DF|nr:heavy-metal-associated domain-containing protein [Allomuricauda beolgyonensis]